MHILWNFFSFKTDSCHIAEFWRIHCTWWFVLLPVVRRFPLLATCLSYPSTPSYNGGFPYGGQISLWVRKVDMDEVVIQVFFWAKKTSWENTGQNKHFEKRWWLQRQIERIENYLNYNRMSCWSWFHNEFKIMARFRRFVLSHFTRNFDREYLPYTGIFSRRVILAKMTQGRCVNFTLSPIFAI